MTDDLVAANAEALTDLHDSVVRVAAAATLGELDHRQLHNALADAHALVAAAERALAHLKRSDDRQLMTNPCGATGPHGDHEWTRRDGPSAGTRWLCEGVPV